MRAAEKIKTLVTREKREEGIADIIVCLFFVIIILWCIGFNFKLKKIELTKANLEDGLTTSTLAALIFDVDELSASGEICINVNKSFDIFEEMLKTNLDLNNDMSAKNPIYYDNIRVKSYVIYNVKKNDVTRIQYNPSNGASYSTEYREGLGNIIAENGEKIESSSIYVELEINLTGFAGGSDTTVTVDNLLALSATGK